MKIPDRELARRHLSHINYYRLRAYWLPFEQNPNGRGGHQFISGTCFNDILTGYNFDRRLRLFLLDAIERVEVSFRTLWAHTLSLKYGAHAYLKPHIFMSLQKYSDCLDSLKEEIARSKETFVQHYRRCYTDPDLPPIWAVCEIMSLGQLSKWFQNLKHRQDRIALAKSYGLDEGVVQSFIHHLTHVRNLCAHHSRLWNRLFTVTMQLPKYPELLSECCNPHASRKIYNTLVMLGYILKTIIPDSTWIHRLRQLINEFPRVDLAAMGFPRDWEKLSIWMGNNE